MAQRDSESNGSDLGFEADLFKAADKLRGNMEPSDYKHVALGLLFLKYISDAFEAKHEELLTDDPEAAEDKDEYTADNVFFVPPDARWSHLKANAKQPNIGTLIDDAMRSIEKGNESLKGVLSKDYARPALNKMMLGQLIDLFSNVALNEKPGEAKDLLGRAYEYFLSEFAGAEGKRGGEFYTPRSVVRVLVEMLERARCDTDNRCGRFVVTAARRLCVCRRTEIGCSRQSLRSVAAAAATFWAASRIDSPSPMVRPDRPASRGLTSRRASNVVPWATGITRSVKSSAESSLSATPCASRLWSIAGVTSTIPIRDIARPLSISRRSDLPSPTSVSLNHTVAPLATSWSYRSFATPCRSSQAWQRKRSRWSG